MYNNYLYKNFVEKHLPKRRLPTTLRETWWPLDVPIRIEYCQPQANPYSKFLNLNSAKYVIEQYKFKHVSF